MTSRRCFLCWYYLTTTTTTTTTTAVASSPVIGAWLKPIYSNSRFSRTRSATNNISTRFTAISSSSHSMSSTTSSSEQPSPHAPSTAEREQDAAFNVGQKDIGLESAESNVIAGNMDQSNDGKVSWRRLIERSIAKSRDVRGGNYVQLATVDAATMEARCRTVVFRGFLPLPPEHPYRCCVADDDSDLSCVMKMITHRRSKKVVEELSHNSKAEIVWWFSRTNEQYRIRGRVLLIGNGIVIGGDDGGLGTKDGVVDPILAQARREQWGNLRDGAREEYFRAPTPGDSFDEEAQHSPVPSGGRDENTGKLLPAPDDFMLMLLVPNYVDYLRLTNMYRQIDQLQEDAWVLQRVNP